MGDLQEGESSHSWQEQQQQQFGQSHNTVNPAELVCSTCSSSQFQLEHHQAAVAVAVATTGTSTAAARRPSRALLEQSQGSLLQVSETTRGIKQPIQSPVNLSSSNTISAFSSGSTPALTLHEREQERRQSIEQTTHTRYIDDSAGTLSPLREYFKRRQSATTTSTDSGNAAPATRGTKGTSSIQQDDFSGLSLLLLPQSKKHNQKPEEERLYIAARNKVHRPRPRRKSVNTSTTKVHKATAEEQQQQQQQPHLHIRTHSTEEKHSLIPTKTKNQALPLNQTSPKLVVDLDQSYPTSTVDDPSSLNMSIFGRGGSNQRSASANASSAARGGVNIRDYALSPSSASSISHRSEISPPHSASTGTGIGTGTYQHHHQYNSGMSHGPPSSKASQMLGLSSSYPDGRDIYNQTSSFHSSHSGGGGGGHNLSPLAPGMVASTSASSSNGSNNNDKGTSNTGPSHTRMTLKKARSLFTGSSKSSSKDKNTPSPSNSGGMPSPTLGGPRPIGMGSYGNEFGSASSSMGLPASSSTASFGNILGHSKSYASLANNSHSNGHGYSTPPFGSASPSFSSGLDQHLMHSSPPSHPYASSSRSHAPQPLPFTNGPTSDGRSPHSPVAASTTRGGQHQPQHQEEKDITCPVCLESLSIRLQGEKPHVVPVCGHKLHNECFETAYGTTVAQILNANERIEGVMLRRKKQSLGICGICRSEMKIGDPSESGKNKFAILSGQPGRSAAPPSFDTHKIHSISKRTIGSDDEAPTSASLHDPSEDQDVLNPHQLLPAYMQHLALGPSRSSPFSAALEKVMPKISVRAEHTTLARLSDPEKRVHLTCLVTVEIPSRIPILASTPPQQQAARMITASASQRSLGHPTGHALDSQSTLMGVHLHSHDGRERSSSNPGSTAAQTIASSGAGGHHGLPASSFRRESNATAHTHGTEDFPTSPSVSTFSGGNGRISGHGHLSSGGMEKTLSSATTASSSGHHMSNTPATTASAGFTPHSTSASSFSEDASSRDVHSSAGNSGSDVTSPYTGVGGYNTALNASAVTLTAAQEEKTREAHGPFADVFEDLQDRMADWKGHQPNTFGSLRMYDSLAVKKDKNVREFVVYLFEEALLCVVDDRKKAAAAESDKLRLKGRVFVKHMSRVEDTSSVDGGLSLTIHMEDDSLENFVILFPQRESLEVWRSQIQALIDHHRPPIPSSDTKSSFATSGTNTSRRDSVFSNETTRSAQSGFSRVTKGTTSTSISGSGPMPEGAIPPVPSLKKSMPSLSNISNEMLNWTPPDPATFVPLDLMLVLSVPRANATGGPSSNSMKIRLLRSTLDFIIHSVGPRARISIVTYTTGDASQASLRKTPWLATGRPDGLRRLEQAANEIGGSTERFEESLTTVDPKEDKITVTTAVNLALDIILQRQSKSTTCGMIVLNDGKDGAQKQQIDLVMARADAGGVPIHSFGWGKSHDPSSLWLLSNHTKGTYTFVRDFYALKDAMAGCIGGMLCVAVHNLRLHLNVQERKWFKIRKVAGVAGAIVSSDGKDVDINLGELRFGEKKEMLVEIEMASPKMSASSTTSTNKLSPPRAPVLTRKKSLTATDNFFLRKVGVDPLSFGDADMASSDFFEEVGEAMADDVPVFDVNASFKNPQDPSSEVCKLPYPSLLTISVTPPAKTNLSAPDSPTSTASGSQTVSDPTVVRRRMELLTSDMITRTLLLMSRRQDAHAQRLLTETTRIFAAITANLIPPSMNEQTISPETRYANDVLQACLEDIEQLKAGCLDRAEFDSATRNFGAQQAVALRDQRAWTGRTATETLFFCREWTAIFSRALTNQI